MRVRILMTADAVGGVWEYALELARGLAENAEILLATMGPPPSPDQIAELATIPRVSLRTGDFALEWMESPWEDVDRAGRWLAELERTFSPDVVHLNGYAHAAVDFEAPIVVVAHSCVTTWWRAVHGGDPPPAWHHYRQRVERGLRSADRVVAPSAAMLDALRGAYRFATASTVIPNGVQARAFAPAEKEPLVAAAGRLWDEAKNVRRLVEAAPESPWPIAIAGEGGGESSDGNVRFLGRVPRTAVASLLGRASTFVHPPLYEPFGLAPLEAALSGCALVLADIPSLRETWTGRAMFVDPRDSRAIGAALRTLATNPSLRAELAQQARVHGAGFTARRMASRYLDLYRSLVAAARHGTSASRRKETRTTDEDRPLLPLAHL